jgi:hypothetical protein
MEAQWVQNGKDDQKLQEGFIMKRNLLSTGEYNSFYLVLITEIHRHL